MHCPAQCPRPCSRPPLTHASTRDSWTLTGKSGSVPCGVTASFSWVLVCTQFCLCPLRVCFPVLCKFWQLYGGVNGDILQEGLCHTQVCCTQSPCPCGSPLLTRTGHRNHPLPKTQETTHGHHHMVNTKIKLIIFFAAKDIEALHSQQKQDRELTVAQILNSLLANSDLN